MSLYKGDTLIAGGSTYHPNIFDTKWSDHIINDIQWLRADTFSWQDGTVYTTAYNKLVEEYATGSEETEGSITFKRTTNGFKIATSDYESDILSKYTSDGIAWYYILDTTNTRFKLPRTKFGFEGIRSTVGGDIAESLPNITGSVNNVRTTGGTDSSASGALSFRSTTTWCNNTVESTTHTYYDGINFDASESYSTYQDNAPVQERATQMYLYFYVGEYSQTAIEQTAGITTEQLNSKLDLVGGTMTGQLNINTSKATPLTLMGNVIQGTSSYQDIQCVNTSSNRVGNIRFQDTGSANAIYFGLMQYGTNTNKGGFSIQCDSNGKFTYSPVQLITTYVNGTSGYNIWSNGYCEQWGKSSMSTSVSISLAKTYATTNYNIQITDAVAASSSTHSWGSASSVNSFTITGSSSTTSLFWKTSGYLASGQY